jgi:hypothetical protein
MDEHEDTAASWVTFTDPDGNLMGRVQADESALDMLDTIQTMGALDNWTVDIGRA